MWLTGFDAPTVSTLYLDKPQKDHTLMQTIARANRMCSHEVGGVEKKNGEMVDYYGILGRLKKAIKDYGQGGDGADDALETEDVFQKVGLFKQWADLLLEKDEWRKTFSVYENTITALYEASKPEILGKPIVRVVAVFQYLRGVIDSIIQQQDVESAARQISELLDESLVVDEKGRPAVKELGPAYQIQKKGPSWDLSKIDFDKLKDDFKKTSYKKLLFGLCRF